MGVVWRLFSEAPDVCAVQCASIAVLDLAGDHSRTDRAADATIEFVTAFHQALKRSCCFGAGGEAGGGGSMSGRARERAHEDGREEKEDMGIRRCNARGVQHCMYVPRGQVRQFVLGGGPRTELVLHEACIRVRRSVHLPKLQIPVPPGASTVSPQPHGRCADTTSSVPEKLFLTTAS